MRRAHFQNIWQKLTFSAGVVVLLLAVSAVAWVPKAVAAARDCDSNAVIYCGFGTNSEFIKQVRSNNSGNGHHDLKTVFSHFGLSSADYDRFIKEAKSGTVYKDGRIVVGGQVVTKSTKSLGRTVLRGGRTAMKIDGKTYYYSPVSTSFLSSSLPAKVLFNSKGEVEFAVLPACGNPVWGTNVKNGADCKLLKKEAVAGKADTFKFTTTASASGNAKISKYVYDFGDGTTKTTTSKSVTYQYKKPGTFTVKVTAFASVPGGKTIASTGVECQKTVTVDEPAKPYYECLELKGPEPDGLTYSFTAVARFGNGAKFTGADFTFGDGKSITSVRPTTSDTVVVKHTYEKEGTYTASATLHFDVSGRTVSAATCKAVVSPSSEPVPECKPGIPVGDVRCNPCPYDSSLSADDENCQEVPPELPNTGAGNIVAVTGAALVGGFLFYRHREFRRHRKAFQQADLGTSPLPLADPIAPDDPLAGTPLEPETQATRSTFRRHRQF